MPDDAPLTLRVVRCGAVARRLFSANTRAKVAAVFDRSFYVEADGSFACIGSGTIGDGPLNAIVSETSVAPALARLQIGQPIALSPVASQASIQIDATQAATWQPPAWRPLQRSDCSRIPTSLVRRFAITHAPGDGLSRLVMDSSPGKDLSTPFFRVALPRIEEFKSWFVEAAAHRESDATPPPVGLLGLGPGLTPSGDDVLGALMIALDAIAQHALRARIARAVLQAAPIATSPLSAAFLRASAEGLGSSALHDFIASIIGGANDATVLATARTLVAIGHTSGWDALAGAMLGLQVLHPT